MNFSADEDLAFATPRSWEMVSNILWNSGGDEKKTYPLIAGCVGIGIALEFRSWCKVYDNLPDIQEIFNGKEHTIPSDTDQMYAVISSMVAYAKTCTDDMAKMANSIRYGAQFPPDFAAVLFGDYAALKADYKHTMMRVQEFVSWLSSAGKYFSVWEDGDED
jgi:hypothetical protein